LSEEIGDWFGGGITMEELESTVLSAILLGPEEKLLSMGQGGERANMRKVKGGVSSNLFSLRRLTVIRIIPQL